ncbi:cysteine desulfurase family protein [Paenarthrobacter ureafaciens]|uniref:cysteine desulfurase family protein n=1 Tax=Paenarthrobacter ureafaciens TaxID=37931 RepID=UPI001FB2590B|nr:cysteine desulfurase family protein [Paenarthrobacter ureafaciens]UOD82315.1 cysteine desulfurase [Paenarthrobacter ureafaciens]WNZ05813.1 cysteine desulfurase family protein [Paenarthrobacter ureafaciens]
MIYLDFQATTPVDDDVANVVDKATRELWANPSSPHMAGMRSQEAIGNARRRMSKLLGCRPHELYFTSGATEANNWAVSMVGAEPKNHIVTTTTEHKSMLDACRAFQRRGGDLTVLPVNSRGFVNPDELRRVIKPATRLVSVMAANNETGALQPIPEIAEVTRDAGVPLHTDATQAVGYVIKDFTQLPADLISFSGHKIYGPKGAGALYISERLQASSKIPSLLHGGGQEGGRRPGTENLPAILGFARALELSRVTYSSERERVKELKNEFWNLLSEQVPSVVRISPVDSCLPNCLNIRIPGVDAGELMAAIPQIAISAGSACNSNDQQPSHVLLAMGLTADEARTSIRIGFGRATTAEEVRDAAKAISVVVSHLKVG